MSRTKPKGATTAPAPGRQISAARQRAGWTQQQLATKLGATARSFVSNLELGRERPGLPWFRAHRLVWDELGLDFEALVAELKAEPCPCCGRPF